MLKPVTSLLCLLVLLNHPYVLADDNDDVNDVKMQLQRMYDKARGLEEEYQNVDVDPLRKVEIAEIFAWMDYEKGLSILMKDIANAYDESWGRPDPRLDGYPIARAIAGYGLIALPYLIDAYVSEKNESRRLIIVKTLVRTGKVQFAKYAIAGMKMESEDKKKKRVYDQFMKEINLELLAINKSKKTRQPKQ